MENTLGCQVGQFLDWFGIFSIKRPGHPALHYMKCPGRMGVSNFKFMALDRQGALFIMKQVILMPTSAIFDSVCKVSVLWLAKRVTV